MRKFLAPLVAVTLAALSVTSLVVLERRASGYRIAQATLANASAQFALVSVVPLDLSTRRGALRAAGEAVDQSESEVEGKIAQLDRSWPIPELAAVSTHVQANFAAINQLEQLAHRRRPQSAATSGTASTPPRRPTTLSQAVAGAPAASRPAAGGVPAASRPAAGGPPAASRPAAGGVPAASGPAAGGPPTAQPGSGPNVATDAIAKRATSEGAAAKRAMQKAKSEYDQLASSAQTEALIATFVAVAVLLGAFLVFYFRWLGILRRTERDARSDSLTGLGNRRALLERLEAELPHVSREHPLVLTLYDLDGFKAYNDNFGHLEGDAVLTRFSARLRESLGPNGTAYRMGGDEFCSLVAVQPDRAKEHITRAREVLSESGVGFEITCSAGSVLLPEEAASLTEALSLADARMYEHKGLTKRRLEGAAVLGARAS